METLMAVHTVNERSSARLTVAFKDFDDNPSAPAEVYYTVFVRDTGLELKARTSITPAATVQITLSKNETQIVDNTKRQEAHSVLVEGIYSATDEVNDTFTFEVVNLKQLSGT